MAASPEQVRAALQRVTTAAGAEVATVAETAPPDEVRAALFAATPLIIGSYAPAAAVLAADWFEEIREAAALSRSFTPTPRVSVDDTAVGAMVARTTVTMHSSRGGEEHTRVVSDAVELLIADVERTVTDTFRETVTGNTEDDPEAVGWRRFAKPGACKFCLMLAARGAVYTKATARFAAHGAEMRGGRKGGNCMCLAGPAFSGRTRVDASPMQYLASRRQRSPKDRARLRDYLNENFPDAPG